MCDYWKLSKSKRICNSVSKLQFEDIGKRSAGNESAIKPIRHEGFRYQVMEKATNDSLFENSRKFKILPLSKTLTTQSEKTK